MRIRSLQLAAALSLLLAPASAAAQYDPRYPGGTAPAPARPAAPPPQRPPPPPPGPGPTGLTLGARFGYGWPGGDISDEGDPRLGDLVDHKLPIWLELGYRFNPAVRGGVFIELAPTTVSDVYCPPGQSCDAFDWRFGVDLQLHLRPGAPVDPWVGVGLGVEVLQADTTLVDPLGNPFFGEVTYTAFELPMLEGGLDLALGRWFTLGPFVSWSLGTYTSVEARGAGFTTTDVAIHDRALHQWLELGIKGTFSL
ncbi:MAG: hypothetical protein QM767_05680 [Anaeromyxobacter sp.]